MRYFSCVLVTLAWGLWIGSLVAVFVLIMGLAREFAGDTESFGRAASSLFHAYEVYQLFLAAAALTAAFVWLAADSARPKIAVFVLFALAAAAAIFEYSYLSPHIDTLRLTYQTGTRQFHYFHKLATYVYLSQTILMAAAGFLLPLGMRADRRKSTS